MRICSFFSSATELLYALGAGRSVVGRSERCDYPVSARRAPVVVHSRIASARLSSRGIDEAVQALRRRGAHQYEIDVPLLKRLRPDLVVTQELCSVCAASHPEVLDAVRQLPRAPKVVSVTARCVDELLASIAVLGEAIGRSQAARALTERLRRDIQAVRHRVRRARPQPSVWCAEWLDPLMAAGHWIPELVAMAGGKDGLGRPGEDSARVPWEDIRRYDPDVVFVMPCSFSIQRTVKEFPLLARLPGWPSLRAAKTGRVFAVEGAWFHRPGPRLVQGLALMAALLHPDRFPKPPAARATALSPT
jgi:iron complex transport system substrate-binding protein